MTPESSSPVQDTKNLNLADLALFGDGPPHELFDALRSEAPVHWTSTEEGGVWNVLGHTEVVAASRNQTAFISSEGVTYPRLTPEAFQLFSDSLIFMDPPRHTDLRKLVSKGFSPRIIKHLEERIRDFSIDLVGRLRDQGEVDFVKAVAAELPAHVIADILGVPGSDRTLIVKWGNALFGREEPEIGMGRFFEALNELIAYVVELRDFKRRHPSDDVFTRLIDAEVDGRSLTEGEFLMFFVVLAEAGFETTHTLLAQGMRLFLERPEIRGSVWAEPDNLSAVVEELLRYVTPLNYFARTATSDVNLGGRRIREGDYLMLWYAAANRDPLVFSDPHRFEPRRTANRHVSFGGGGSHFCLGANLARTEVRIFLEELIASGLQLELAGQPVRMPSIFVNGLKQLPVAAK